MSADFRRGPGRRVGPVAALLALVVSVAGCASIPDSGPVDEVRDVQPKGQQDGHVRVFALPPQDNGDPVTIVDGFLEALTSDEAGFDTARLYLTKKAQETWRPEDRTVVFNRPVTPLLERVDRDTVALKAEEAAQVDPSGQYQPSPPGQRLERRFELANVKGQWRIAGVPDGVYVSTFDFQRLYRPLNTYFFDRNRNMLVPDPVYVPSRSGQHTTLVRTLLDGPNSLLGSAVVTAFPPGTALVGDRVPIEGGVPHVRLNRAVLSTSAEDRDAMAAQLVHTMAQLRYPEVLITAEGGDFMPGGTTDLRTVRQYQKYDPTIERFSPRGHFVQNGKLMQLLGKPLAPVPGPFGTGRTGYRSFAVALGNDQIAAVTSDGRHLHVGGATGAAQASVRLSGTSLSRPSYDAFGRIWVVDRRPAGSTVWMVPERGNPQRVAAPELESAQVKDLRMAADGTRVAIRMSVGRAAALWTGRVELKTVEVRGDRTTDQLAISGLRRIAAQAADVLDVSWSGPGQLTLLGEDGQQVRLPYRVNFDGSGLTAGQGVPSKVLSSIAAAEDQPLLAATSEGNVGELSTDGRLSVKSKGTAPIYPG